MFIVFIFVTSTSKRSNWQHLQEYLSPSKTLGSHLNLPLFLIIIVHARSEATFFYAAWLKFFWSPHIETEVKGSEVLRCLWLLMPKVWISLKTLSAPLATRNKAWAGLSGNPACKVLVSKVTRRQQMNPVVGVAEAMIERRRRQRSSFFLRLSRENLMRRIGGEATLLFGWRQEESCGETSMQKATERRIR